MHCNTRIANINEIAQMDQLLADYDLRGSQMYQVALTGLNAPTGPKRFYFPRVADFYNRRVTGLVVASSNDMLASPVMENSVNITVPTLDLYGQFTVSFWDTRTQKYKLQNMPLALFMSQSSTGPNTGKVPYMLLDLVPDFNKSYLMLNSATGFAAPPYSLFFYFFYQNM